MHWIFALTRFFPYWALPLVLMFFETGVYFRRRRRTRPQLICWAVAVLLFVSIGAWFFYRGDLHSDQWVRFVVDYNQ